MKKQNIIDLLCDDFIEKHNIEKKNFNSIVKDDKDYKELPLHIHTFLINNYKLLNLDFKYNIHSKEDLEKYKSIYLLYFCIDGVIDILSIKPDFFKHYENKYGTDFAYDEICFRYLVGNILDIKKRLKKIDDNMTNTFKEFLDNIKNIIDNA